MRVMPVSDRNAGKCRDGYCARHARNNFERYSGPAQNMRLLATAPKHEGISTLQAAHRLAFTSLFNHEPVDRVLLKVFLSRLLAYIDDFSIPAGFIEKVVVDQTIVKN